jgi:hypothetical protein
MPANELAEIDIAYIAGLFDGEGYITIRKQHKTDKRKSGTSYIVVIGVVNKDIHVLSWLKNIYGGYIYEKARYSKKHAPTFEWVLMQRQACSKMLADILPFTKIKIKQVQLAQDFLSLGFIKKSGVWPTFNALPEELALRDAYKEKLSLLNKRGQ